MFFIPNLLHIRDVLMNLWAIQKQQFIKQWCSSQDRPLKGNEFHMGIRTHFRPGGSSKHDEASPWKEWPTDGNIHHHVKFLHRISSDTKTQSSSKKILIKFHLTGKIFSIFKKPVESLAETIQFLYHFVFQHKTGIEGD